MTVAPNEVPEARDLASDRYGYLDVQRLPNGDVCELFSAVGRPRSGGPDRAVILKVARSPSMGDLVENEAAVLDRLRRDAGAIFEGAECAFPEVLDTFTYKGRQANVLARAEGYYTLEEVRRDYPEGLRPQAAAWIANRLFETLTLLSLCNVVHGAILPPHALFHFGDAGDPIRHSIRLLDWTVALQRDPAESGWPRLRGRIARYSAFYPREGPDQVTPATDLAMAAACVQYALGDVPAPPAMAQMLGYCRADNPAARPSILDFRDQFRAMLERTWGRHQFYHTPMPRL